MSILTNQIGVSITESSIQLVEIVNKEDKIFLENVDEEYFEESLYETTKEAKFIHILQNAFNEIILRSPLKSNKISVTLPPSYFRIFEIPADKNLTKNDLNEYIKWELTKLFPDENADNLVTQKLVLDTPTFQSYKRVLIYSINENILRRIHKFCVRNSLTLKYIDNAHVASSALIDDDSNILSIYAESKDLSIILYSNNNIFYQVQKQFNSISQIPELISSTNDEIKERELLSKGVELSYMDGISTTNELKNSISTTNNISFKDFAPFSKLEISDNLINSNLVTENAAKFASATSIALRLGL